MLTGVSVSSQQLIVANYGNLIEGRRMKFEVNARRRLNHHGFRLARQPFVVGRIIPNLRKLKY